MVASTTVAAQGEELHRQVAAAEPALVGSVGLWSTLMVAVTTMASVEHVGV